MHGAGNDYIYVNTLKYPIESPEKLSVEWSAPHTGIGSDGLVLIGSSDKADFSMRIFNADGSEAKMCGNASRCIGKYLYEYGLTSQTAVTLDTLSGIKILKLHVEDGKVNTVTVDMGRPSDMKEQPIEANGQKFTGTTLSMGNPHLVIFVEDIKDINLESIGPKLENHPLFPDRINVEFAQVLEHGKIRMRVWERGSGITQACRSLCHRSSCRTDRKIRKKNRHHHGWRLTYHRMGRKNGSRMDDGRSSPGVRRRKDN